MRVLIISCVYPPEPVVSAQTSADLARALAERGHAVTVVTTFPNRPAGEVYPGYSRRLFRRMPSASGVAVLRCFALLSPRSRLLSRLLENLSFGVTGCIAVLLQPRPDVIYANTWPIIATGLLCLAARLRRIPVVVSLQDVYPESLVVQGRLRPEGRVARLLRRMDTAIAHSAAALVAISPSFAALYQATRHVAPKKVAVIPNWIDGRTIDPDDARAATVRGEFGIPADARLVVYGGNVGVAAGVETLIDAFHLLAADHLHLLIAGEGSQLDDCRQRAREQAAGAVSFCTPWLTADTSRVLGAADLLVLPTRGRQSLASVPSKLISYMLAARPIIALADRESDLARVVQLSDCGWVVPPDLPAALAERLRTVTALPAQELARRGQAGRAYALGHFVSDICLPMAIRVVEESPDRLDQIVAVHLDAFPGFFMTQLGRRFLRAYYRCVVQYEGGILLTEDRAGECIGFVAGFMEPAGFYRALRRRRLRLAFAAGAGLVTRPWMIGTLLADYGRAGGAARQPAGPRTAELSSLGVKPTAAGGGLGSRLARGFIEAAGALGAEQVRLTTDTHGNDSVNAFYQRLGFTLVRNLEARRGRWLNEYEFRIRKD